ncbi:MAG: hypothetical protein AABY64_12155 [Bdellovibrionota bacterium]
MKLEVAQTQDSSELKEFFKGFPTSGPIDLKIDRPRDFFLRYSIESDQCITYSLRADKTQLLEGLASFVVKDVLVNKEETTVAFARDLRISQHRKTILTWGQHVLPVMSEIEKTLGAKIFFSVLNMNEVQALNTFLHPRDQRRNLPRYYLYRKFHLVSLHGRFPWASNPLPKMKIRRASIRTWDAVLHYIAKKSQQKNLSGFWNSTKISEQIERWRGLDLSDFLIAMDRHDNVVGCVAPWSSGGIEEFIPMKYGLRAHNFRQFLKFGRWLGWTRTLTKPYSRLKVEAPLNFRYLCFLNADNEDIFESLLHAAFDEARENEFLVYLQMKSDLTLRRPLDWITTQSAYGLYAMIPPELDPPAFLHPRNDQPVELEPFFAV